MGNARKTVLSFLALFLVLAFSAARGEEDQDVVILKTGGMYKGRIVSTAGAFVKMEVKGRIITIKKRDIRKIIPRLDPKAVYKSRLKELARDDVDGRYALALWCKEKGLEKEAERLLKQVIKQDPDHEGARRTLGFGRYQGKWLPAAELAKKGLVPFGEAWIRKEDLAAAKAKRRAERLRALPSLAERGDALLEEGAAAVGVEGRRFRIHGELLYRRFRRDPTRLFAVREPLAVPPGVFALGRELLEGLAGASSDPEAVTAFLADRLGEGGNEENPEEGGTSKGASLPEALAALWGVKGRTPSAGESAALKQQSLRLPPELRDGLVPLVEAFGRAARYRAEAFADVTLADLRGIVDRDAFGDPAHLVESLDLAEEVSDLERFDRLRAAAVALLQGARALGQALEGIRLPPGVARKPRLLDVETPLGRIVVAGEGDDTFEKAAALLVDLGGDDTYRAPAASTAAAPEGGVSLLLDLSGNDQYLCSTDDAFGSGRFGVGVHLDLEGNDTYSAVAWSLGAAFVGWGLLYDAGGDDTYECGTYGEGAARFGYGLLLDGGGKDTYRVRGYGQGFGGTLGVGLLLDREGNDTYVSKPAGDRTGPEFVQGAARGYRDLPTLRERAAGAPASAAPGNDRAVALSGGVGIVADLEGDDDYEAVHFAQGAALWSGLGVLLDRSGDDRYTADDLSQGAGAELASGLLLDVEGDDTYRVAARGQGFASLFSVGALADYYGNDRYEGGALTLGAARGADSRAFFLDGGGADRYQAAATAFGYAGEFTPVEAMKLPIEPLALFLDLSGRDAYQGRKDAGEGRRWSTKSPPALGEDR